MYAPSGLVISATAAQKRRIRAAPFGVIEMLSEPLRVQQHVDQVREEPDRDDAPEDVIRSHRSEPVAAADVGDADQEEGERDREEDDVRHPRLSLADGAARAVPGGPELRNQQERALMDATAGPASSRQCESHSSRCTLK